MKALQCMEGPNDIAMYGRSMDDDESIEGDIAMYGNVWKVQMILQCMEVHLIKVNLHLRSTGLLSVQSLKLNKESLMTIIFKSLMTIIFKSNKGRAPGQQ